VEALPPRPTAALTVEALPPRRIAETLAARRAIVVDRRPTEADLHATARRPTAAVVARCRRITDRLPTAAADLALAAHRHTTEVAAVAVRTAALAAEVTPADIVKLS